MAAQSEVLLQSALMPHDDDLYPLTEVPYSPWGFRYRSSTQGRRSPLVAWTACTCTPLALSALATGTASML